MSECEGVDGPTCAARFSNLRRHHQNSIHVMHRVGSDSQETEGYVLHLEERIRDLEDRLSHVSTVMKWTWLNKACLFFIFWLSPSYALAPAF